MRRVAALLLFVPLSLDAAVKPNVISATVNGRTTRIEATDPGAVRLIVKFRDTPLFARRIVQSAVATSEAMKSFDVRFAQFESDTRTLAARVTHTYERVFAGASVTATRAAIPAIERLPYVERVYRDERVEAIAEDGVAKIHADDVWSSFGTRGAGIVVAVIDTGVDYTHPALGGSFGPHARVAGGYDFVNGDDDPMDDNGHGTHVAGIIGGSSKTLTGVAPDVTFLAYKVLTAGGSGYESDIIAAIERATDPDQNGDPSDHAAVVNMSLGGGTQTDDPMVQAVETATSAGVVFSIAAGNSGGFFTVSSPAIAPSAIAVGASDLDDHIAKFSSGGPAGAYAIKPEVVAPGVDIVSAMPGGGLIAHSGTSMAAPHVAGVAALVKSVHPQWSAAEIKSAIVTTADDIGADVMAQGAGRVNALRAASADLIAQPPVLGLGRDGRATSAWNGSGTIALTNRSSGVMNVAASTTGMRNGVTATVTPAALALAPGETQTVTVDVRVDNAAVPFPEEGSLAISGNVVFSGGASPIHVPWAFERAASLTATYDTAGATSIVVVGTNGTPHVRFANNPLGARRTEVFVPPGTYIVQFAEWIPEDDRATAARVIVSRQTITEDVEVGWTAAMASAMVKYGSRDDTGRLLHDIGKDGVCWNSLFFTMPDGARIPWTLMDYASDDGTPLLIKVSPLPDGVAMTGSESCTDGSSLWIAQHGSIEARTDDADVAADPQSWVHVPMKIVAPANLRDTQIVIGRALLTRSMHEFSAIVEGEFFPFSTRDWSGTIHITREAHPWLTAGAWLRLDSFEAAPSIAPPIIRAANDGAVVLSPERTTAPTTYVARPGEILAFGDGPAHPIVSTCVAHGGLMTGGSWAGSLDEERTIDRTERWILRDDSGATVLAAWPAGGVALPRAGVYQLEFGRTATIAGAPSDATLTARFDSRLADPSPPILGSFRIVDALGHDTAFVNRNSDARVTFSSFDRVPDAECRTYTHALVAASRTTVSWRPHGATAWQPLEVSAGATEITNTEEEYYELGHFGIGTHFAANLRAATQAADRIDLRVHVEDESGNAIDYVLAPAFTVVPDARRRAVK